MARQSATSIDVPTSPLSYHSASGSIDSSQDAGSDYSQPDTASSSRPPSLQPRRSSSARDDLQDVALHSRPSSYRPRPSSKTTSREGFVTPPRPHSDPPSDYSGSPSQSRQSPATPTMAASPFAPHDPRMSVNSLQSITLSEADYDYVDPPTEPSSDALQTPRVRGHSRKHSSLEILENVWSNTWSAPRRTQSTDEHPPPTRQSTLFDMSIEESLTPTTPTIETESIQSGAVELPDASREARQFPPRAEHPNRSSRSGATLNAIDASSIWRTERFSSLGAPTQISSFPEDELQVDWSNLDRTEEQEKEDKDIPEGGEDESTRFLLARLEQENAKFTVDPKSSLTNKAVGRARSQSRPPSMAHIKRLISKDTPSIRYSLVPEVQNQVPDEPPPMTELEFWAALVQDYPSTAARLPTLTTTKIRAGIPPPLRGVVWTSMSGARDRDLEEAFDTLQNEQSSYEGIINKDVGRSFPGVELFRDAEGEGQKMLGRVLKCFSLHDKDIGYCQGLGFLVGPLLMNMGEKDAFCVLVRLMDHYALRPSFLPSLSGLHMRIFQFSCLLKQHHPKLAEHLAGLGVEPAYLTQWFLSCFAVTCPLPMLFRIYDVIFAEGANETVMRVALALFRRNEEKMMASNEFEDVMQLLLGRALWDVYACNADDLVDDFTSLGNIITHARLAELEREFQSKDRDSVGQSAGFLPDVQAAASRFLGRLWAPTHGLTPSKGGLTPHSAEKDSSPYGYLSRPSAFLRRTPSKQSLGAINDNSSSESSGTASVTSTVPTDSEVHDSAGRESQADSTSMRSKSESMVTVPGSTSAHAQQLASLPGVKEQELQSEIEDLLMALSEMQREHAQLAAMLQREREERNDDHKVVKHLLNKLSNDEGERKAKERRSMPPPPRPKSGEVEATHTEEKRKTLPPLPYPTVEHLQLPAETKTIVHDEHKHEVEDLVQQVQSRLDSSSRFSASFETRAQLRGALARTRQQLSAAELQIKDLSERAEASESSLANNQVEDESLRAEVEELRTRVNDDFKEKKKLELTIENLQIQMRMEAKALEKKQRTVALARSESSSEVPTLKKSDTPNRSRTGSLTSNPGSAGGLKELKLGRPESGGSAASVRSMKGQRQNTDEWPIPNPPPSEVIEIATSPPRSPEVATTPVSPAPVVHPTLPPSSSLTVPSPEGPYFARRTTSLATQAVIATPAHEPVPEDALLLELVNAKTAEATARQELDEMRKQMQTQKRRAEESLLELEAAVASAKLEAEQARGEADHARQEAKAAIAEGSEASELHTPLTPAVAFSPMRDFPDSNAKSGTPPPPNSTSPAEPEPKESDSAGSSFGGWFWNRRQASATVKLPRMESK